jgi:hypothetical protein
MPATRGRLSFGIRSPLLGHATTAEIRRALAERAKGDSVPLGAAIWIVTAVNPG